MQEKWEILSIQLFLKKLCKDKENPELNNGSGFIRLKTKEICSDIIEKFNKINTNPKDKVLLDPGNLFEIKNRPIYIKLALSKESQHNVVDNKKVLIKDSSTAINIV